MHRTYFLIVTAVGEAAIGLALLAVPSVPLGLLLGLSGVGADASLIARIAGAALVGLGLACWPPRDGGKPSVSRALLAGLLFYDVAAAALLAYAGLGLGMSGIALWPGVALHVGLAIWCVVCLMEKRRR